MVLNQVQTECVHIEPDAMARPVSRNVEELGLGGDCSEVHASVDELSLKLRSKSI